MKRIGFPFAAGCALLVFAGLVPVATAATSVVSIVASPAVATLTIQAGKTTTETVTVTNRSSAPAHVSGAIGDLAPVLNGFGPATAGSHANSAASWVSLSPSVFDLPAGGTTSVTVTIRSPAGSSPGGHYAGVLFSAGPAGSTRVASTSLHSLLLEVPGAGITRNAHVNGLSMPAFEINGDVAFRLRVQNTGTTHVRVTGTIEVRDRFRQRTIATLFVSPFYVLPGTEATELIVWPHPPLFAWAHAVPHLAADGGVTGRAGSKGLIVHWLILAEIAAGLLLLRLLGSVIGLRRAQRRAQPPAHRPAPAAAATTGAWQATAPARSKPAAPEAPVPVVAAPAPRAVRTDDQAPTVAPRATPPTPREPKRAKPTAPPAPPREPKHAKQEPAGTQALPDAPVSRSSNGGGLAGRRARTALRMLKDGPGETGVRIEVALGLLRSVRDDPRATAEVEAAYAASLADGSPDEIASLALALHEIDSSRATAALLRAYASAGDALARRLRRALAQCEPADLMLHKDLLAALPPARRRAIPLERETVAP